MELKQRSPWLPHIDLSLHDHDIHCTLHTDTLWLLYTDTFIPHLYTADASTINIYSYNLL